MADEGGFNFGDLLKNKNFLSMLAGIGSNLDPSGAGGAIGKPTQQLIQSQAAQEATGANEKRNREFWAKMSGFLGGQGFTPKEVPGPTSMKIGPDNMTLDITPPTGGGNPFGLPGGGQFSTTGTTPPKTGGLQFSDYLNF